MGQQQILIVILVTIIAGIATIIAINTFASAQEAANLDAIQQDMIEAQSQSFAYFQKPEALGGGGGSYVGITLNHLILPEENENGTYEIASASEEELVLVGRSATSNFTLTATITGSLVVWLKSEVTEETED